MSIAFGASLAKTHLDATGDDPAQARAEIEAIVDRLNVAFAGKTILQSTDRVSNGGPVDDYATGTNLVFFQASAPTGYTQDTTQNDKVLRIVSGTGGGAAGSWTISGVTVDGHVLTDAEMPSHNHGGGSHNHSTGSTARAGVGTRTDALSTSGGPTGPTPIDTLDNGGTGHTHSVGSSGTIISTNGSDAAHSHGLTADGSWRPAYIDVIVATKD